MEKKYITIITKYFLPNVNVDSDSVYDMVKGLLDQNKDLQITIVTSDLTYKGDLALNKKYDQSILKNVIVRKVKPVFPNSKMTSDFILGYQLVLLAKKIGYRTIISLSNPPLITLWHSLLLKKFNFYYWTFDIFPQALVADKLIKSSSILYKFLNRLTYINAPRGIISLGKCQFDYLSKLYGKVSKQILLPCGIHEEHSDEIPNWCENEKIIIGYLGNIGRAHSPLFLENVLKSIANVKNIKLIISIYGFHSNRIKKFINSLNAQNVLFVPSVAKGQLRFIDIHLVSLLPEWANISVPSKAVSAVCSGSSLWYCGPHEVDTFGLFEECSFISTDDVESVENTLKSINYESISIKKKEAEMIKKHLKQLEKKAYEDVFLSIK